MHRKAGTVGRWWLAWPAKVAVHPCMAAVLRGIFLGSGGIRMAFHQTGEVQGGGACRVAGQNARFLLSCSFGMPMANDAEGMRYGKLMPEV